jgi:hypothetical protein
MGWWQISEDPKMVMGDGPADILDRLELPNYLCSSS